MEMMTYEERMDDLKKEYTDFLETKRGREWFMLKKREFDGKRSGDFGDYLYDFYPEMLQ